MAARPFQILASRDYDDTAAAAELGSLSLFCELIRARGSSNGDGASIGKGWPECGLSKLMTMSMIAPCDDQLSLLLFFKGMEKQ